MILGKAKLQNIPHLEIDGKQIDRPTTLKQLEMGLQHRPYMQENVNQVIFPQTAQTMWFINRRFTLLLHYSNKANLRVCMHCLESQYLIACDKL